MEAKAILRPLKPRFGGSSSNKDAMSSDEDDGGDFLIRRNHMASPRTKRAKPLVDSGGGAQRANFNPFASAEPPSFVSLNTSAFDYSEAPSLISVNSSFATTPSFCHDKDDDNMECTSDEEEEMGSDSSVGGIDRDGKKFRLSRRFSSTMFFDQPCTTPPQQQHTPNPMMTMMMMKEEEELLSASAAPCTPRKGRASFFDDAAAEEEGSPYRRPAPPCTQVKVRHEQHNTQRLDCGMEIVSSRFNSEFEVLGQLGTGSFGKVFKVKNRLDGCLYAVKMVQQVVQGKTGRECVLKEVYALAALVNNSDNLHVVRYFSSWIDIDDRLYIQTELCDTSLEAMLQQPMPLEFKVQPTAVDIFKQLLQGLKGLHLSNVVHLDIKPANILVRAGTYKLGDLGHAALSNFDALPAPPPFPNSQSDAIIAVARDFREGDVRYMARELLNEDRTHLPKADIFSLGMAVYEMFLTKVHRKLPSEGDEWVRIRTLFFYFPDDIVCQMSPDFAELMLLMMHPEPAKRPTAEALLVTGGPGKLLKDATYYHTHEVSDTQIARKGSRSHMLKRSNTM